MSGRHQTTKGVWLARSPKVDEFTTLILDLEGSDGRERGEDDTNFERQSALFALAVADVLLINVWCHDIGREQGSGKPLMKTIFQVRVRCGVGRVCVCGGAAGGGAGMGAAPTRAAQDSAWRTRTPGGPQHSSAQHSMSQRRTAHRHGCQHRRAHRRSAAPAKPCALHAARCPAAAQAQVNLKLFAPEPHRRRTVLLFVIRDKSKTPLAKLVEVLSEDVTKMWDSISKPPQYANSQISDFFEVGAGACLVACAVARSVCVHALSLSRAAAIRTPSVCSHHMCAKWQLESQVDAVCVGKLCADDSARTRALCRPAGMHGVLNRSHCCGIMALLCVWPLGPGRAALLEPACLASAHAHVCPTRAGPVHGAATL